MVNPWRGSLRYAVILCGAGRPGQTARDSSTTEADALDGCAHAATIRTGNPEEEEMFTRLPSVLSALAAAAYLICATPVATAAAEKPLRVLYLGDRGHHKPAARYAQVANEMKRRGVLRKTPTGRGP